MEALVYPKLIFVSLAEALAQPDLRDSRLATATIYFIRTVFSLLLISASPIRYGYVKVLVTIQVCFTEGMLFEMRTYRFY